MKLKKQKKRNNTGYYSGTDHDHLNPIAGSSYNLQKSIELEKKKEVVKEIKFDSDNEVKWIIRYNASEEEIANAYGDYNICPSERC